MMEREKLVKKIYIELWNLFFTGLGGLRDLRGLKVAKREGIFLMFSDTQIAAVILTSIVIIFSRNTFSMSEEFLQAIIEVLNGIPILNICRFSLVTIIFSIYPLVTMIRQRTKKSDDDAQVVTEIVEIGTERKDILY